MRARSYLSTLVAQLRALRQDLLDAPQPEGDAPASEHGWYLLGRFVAMGLTVRFWVFVLGVAAVGQAIEWWLL